MIDFNYSQLIVQKESDLKILEKAVMQYSCSWSVVKILKEYHDEVSHGSYSSVDFLAKNSYSVEHLQVDCIWIWITSYNKNIVSSLQTITYLKRYLFKSQFDLQIKLLINNVLYSDFKQVIVCWAILWLVLTCILIVFCLVVILNHLWLLVVTFN